MTWLRFKRRCTRQVLRLFRRAGAPKEIAAGVAVGIFIAALPVLGLQVPLALAASTLLKKLGFSVSGISAASGVWLNNPLTMVPMYTATYFVGLPLARWLLATPAHAATSMPSLSISSLGGEAALALTLGGFLLGLPLAYLGYRLTLRFSQRVAARRARAL